MKAIGKFFKFIFWTVIVLVLLAVVAVLTIPWWVGPTVTKGANFAVPKVVKADFALNRFEFNQYKGTFGMGSMHLANPEGFDPENCLELDAFDVKFDPVSCFTKKVHIEKITLDGLRVVVDFPAAANFKKLADNAQEYCGCCKEEKSEEEEKVEEEDKNPTKVVIDLVEIKNLKVTYGAAPLVVPDFTLTDIGKETGGATWSEATEEIFKDVCDKCGIVVGAVLDAGKVVIDAGAEAAGAVIDAGTEAAGAVMDAGADVVSGVTDGASAAAGAIGDGASAAAGAIGDGASAAAGAIGEGVGSAVDTASDMAGAAAGAASDMAGSVVDKASDMAGAAADAASDMAGAAAKGVSAIIDSVTDAVKSE